MRCRTGCGACCIVPSIAEPFYGMPDGKPSGTRCVHLTRDNRCAIFDRPERPACCAGFRAEPAVCGADRAEALANLRRLELMTL